MNTVIYYPHLYPPAEWLRVAALCWDEVYTLRPGSAPAMPEDIARLDTALGGILRTAPVRDVQDRDLFQTFRTWLEGSITDEVRDRDSSGEWFGLLPPKIDEELEHLLIKHGLARYGIAHETVRVPRWLKGPTERLRTVEWTTPHKPNPRSKLYRKYQELTNRAYKEPDQNKARAFRKEAETFRNKNMITAQRPDYYLFVPRRIAFRYISLLASKSSAIQRSDVATTTEEYAGVLFHDIRAARGHIATAIIEANLPRELTTLDPKQLAEFRSAFATSRLKYQAAIHELVGEFEKVSSEHTLGRVARQILQIANERIEETATVYRKNKVELVSRALALSMTPPALAATIASALGIGIFAPAGIAATLSLFAASTIIDRHKAKLERDRSGWSYIFDVQKLV